MIDYGTGQTTYEQLQYMTRKRIFIIRNYFSLQL